MNYNYSNQTTNPYTNPLYQQRNKLPQTVLNSNTTPRKQVLIRNQSFQNRHYNEDLIQLIAKIRSLQDDLLNERFKNQALQRKISELQKIIDNLEYQMTSQSYQLQKYRHQIEMSNQKNLEILKYQQNLKLVGEEIEELNNILVRKSKDYEIMYEKHKNLQFQLKKTDEENHLLRVNQSIWRKQLDFIIQEYHSYIETTKQNQHRSNSINIQDQLSQINFNNNQFSNNQTKQFSPARNNRQNDDSITFNYNNLNDEMNKKIQLLRKVYNQMANDLNSFSKQLQQTKKDLNVAIIKQKQKYIKLDYEYKLLEQRLKDHSKKQDLISSFHNQKKVQQIIQQLHRKQDQYIMRIQQLSKQNEELKQGISQLQSGNSYAEAIDLQERNSIIQTFRKQNSLLQSTIVELTQKLRNLQRNYEQVVSMTEKQNDREAESSIQISKKIRRVQEQNYQLKIKNQQLIGQVNLLSKQIDILKGQQEQQHQSPSKSQ